MTQKWLLCVIGPTAIGKTKLAIQLANHFQTEILSADSRQFYKEMEIGTAVPAQEELNAAKHHFVHHKSIHEPYSVGDFEVDAIQRLQNLFKNHNILILVGGSGLYVDAVVNGLDDFPVVDPQIRETLRNKLQSEGLAYLQNELKKLDPIYFKQVDIENPHRVIRALEVSMTTAKPYSSFLKQKKTERNFRTLYIGLKADREILYRRINQRVDLMIDQGLINEARSLWKMAHLNALQTVGYKELFLHFEGKLTLDRATEEIKKNTRRFAKRQLTWYRKNKEVQWFDFEEPILSIINSVETKLADKIND